MPHMFQKRTGHGRGMGLAGPCIGYTTGRKQNMGHFSARPFSFEMWGSEGVGWGVGQFHANKKKTSLKNKMRKKKGGPLEVTREVLGALQYFLDPVV
jgi:hypothetical protein